MADKNDQYIKHLAGGDEYVQLFPLRIHGLADCLLHTNGAKYLKYYDGARTVIDKNSFIITILLWVAFVNQ